MRAVNCKDALALLGRIDKKALPQKEREILSYLTEFFDTRADREIWLADLNERNQRTAEKRQTLVLQVLVCETKDNVELMSLSREAFVKLATEIEKKLPWDEASSAGDKAFLTVVNKYVHEYVRGQKAALLPSFVMGCAEHYGWKPELNSDGDIMLTRSDLDGETYRLSVSLPNYARSLQKAADGFDIAEYVAQRLKENRPAYVGVDTVTAIRNAQKIQAALKSLALGLS